MELIALTMDLSPSNFIGIGIGTKVTVISREQFYKELNTPLFRGVYVKPETSIAQQEDFIGNMRNEIDAVVMHKLVFLSRVFNWTKDYKALYYIEYEDVPDGVNPPAYMKIEKLDNSLHIED